MVCKKYTRKIMPKTKDTYSSFQVERCDFMEEKNQKVVEKVQ